MRKGHGAGPRAVPCAGRAAARLQCEEGPRRLDGRAAYRAAGEGQAGPGHGAERGPRGFSLALSREGLLSKQSQFQRREPRFWNVAEESGKKKNVFMFISSNY